MAAEHVVITLLSIFIMVIPGIILRKKGVVGDSSPTVVAGLITGLTFPCMIITSMQLEYSLRIVNNCKYILLIFALLVGISMLIAKLAAKFLKISKQHEGILAFMFVFGNSGFLGVPLLNALFGQEAVFYGALCDGTYNIFMFSIGMNMIKSGTESDAKLSFGYAMKGMLCKRVDRIVSIFHGDQNPQLPIHAYGNGGLGNHPACHDSDRPATG